MKYFLFAVLAISTLFSSANASQQSPLLLSKPKIVGGELASQSAWPWMSALVFTYSDVNSSLDVAGTQYQSEPFTYAPSGQASATMVDCGIGDNLCSLAENKICLIARGEIDFSVKVANCQAAGGIGAIIYNNTSGVISGTLGEGFIGNIPVVAISQDDGALLLNKLDSIATINLSVKQDLAQSASCGASFIGEKWVLTAAHCVEDANIEFLKVNIGEYDLSDGASNAKAIKRIYIHPEYDEGSAFNNDIALIELVESSDQTAVKLLDYNTSKQLAIANSPATVIGWGNVNAYGQNDEAPVNSQPDQLRQVELYLLSNEECKDQLAQAYSDLNNTTYSPNQVGITNSMICAAFSGDVQKGSCQGDSGGPLVVNTNEGWQQIGIVSFGVGCANEAFPDVYARVGNFTTWINNITQGIAIESSYDFALTPQNKAQTTQLTVTNNTNLIANLSFTLFTDNISSNGFSLNTDNCTQLAAKQSCQIQVDFDAKTLGKHKVRIVINSNDVNIPTSQSYISAEAVASNSDINTQLSNGSSELRWFSGGDQPWLLDNSEAAIMSGAIGEDQQSAVLLTFSGAGTLSFDWSVASEENTDTPDEPFGVLYLIIDDKQIKFISGEVAYTKVTIDDLAEGEHQVTWLYKKDGGTSEGTDKASLKNVIFTPTVTALPSPPTPTPLPPSTTDTKSGGGSVYFMLFLLIMLTAKRRLT
ncbi:trypsin-like serine protease [Colwellia sp. Bg11-28]|uniref:trypsin-like serine protease n=1 Tax=Colwellia sp. Bg11-28 TaxID=2058305 RepID=UPI000C34F8B0|nr:trypsin-like serine protease [Colwellia sp. Bg11-28]PKH85751.1 serine protease [Colwellia sp. Bg11-28]